MTGPTMTPVVECELKAQIRPFNSAHINSQVKAGVLYPISQPVY